jgi:RNA polymerase sigma-70 factor (ECF subfamily)
VDEDDLMKRAKEGDAQAFGQLVRRHQRRLVRFAGRMLGDAEAAEDAAQEAFLRLWRARERYRPQGRLTCLLFQIARNICLDYARATWPETCLETADAARCAPGSSVEQRTQTNALAQAVQAAVLDLPESQRVVFVLSQYEGLSYREIGAVLNCPVGTVASRKSQAVETLRRRLRPWREEEERQ